MDQIPVGTESSPAHAASDHDIAIVGMACRVPGARNYREFWDNLKSAKESLTTLSDEQLREAGVPEGSIKHSRYVKAGMFLDDMRLFDPGFFGLGMQDGKIMDPQHRQFLEVCWEAFEDASVNPSDSELAIGVFAGSGHNAYLHYNLLNHPELLDEVGFFLLRHTGNDKDFLATRVSYCFDLKGPSVNVQTACSTSLVAVHTAVQSLLNGECDLALAGGVTINLPDREGYFYKEGEILSPDGHCRPFEKDSSGTVFGSGTGAVLLKRLEEAIRDGDNIHAVIKSTAVNNDGADKVSYLAPSVEGQASAMVEALELAELDPESVGFIECHGTGTELGDPIEVAALAEAYAGAAENRACAIGSVKSNIGHLDTAAGVASLIKAVLSLKHRQLVPTVNYRAPNPAIDFANSRFYVNAETKDWHSEQPRRAAVNSLGVGGTNAHVILEEPPAKAGRQAISTSKAQLLLLSAQSEPALRRNAVKLAEFLGNPESPSRLADVALTLATGRKAFKQRGFIVASESSEAIDKLDTLDPENIVSLEKSSRPRKIAFMFAGGGAQYAGMGHGLYREEPVYRNAVEECLAILESLVDYDLRSLLFPMLSESANAQASDAQLELANRELQRPSRTLPALFVTQYAQAKLWMAMGLQPAALIGHSLGENTAACVAGVLSLKDALGLVALRGQLFEKVPAGGMLSVELDAGDVEKYLSDDIVIAAVNAPGLAVLSGCNKALQSLEKRLDEESIGHRRVPINIAAHSPMLDPILGD
ncbi:MAG: type I polyketide synthase, partial [Pseudomonadales bacterium]|nr:type I polyketide synthase [Pseudomonadales bacterium]